MSGLLIKEPVPQGFSVIQNDKEKLVVEVPSSWVAQITDTGRGNWRRAVNNECRALIRHRRAEKIVVDYAFIRRMYIFTWFWE